MRKRCAIRFRACGHYKESVLQVTARRTYRLTESSACDAFVRFAENRPQAESAEHVEWARAGTRIYVRSKDALAGAAMLPEGTEIFVLRASDAQTARKLQSQLCGPGGVAAVADCVVADCEIVIEIAQNIPLLFAFIDVHTRMLGAISRQALLPLHDATLLRVAEHAWNCRGLEPLRILEVAAGDDVW